MKVGDKLYCHFCRRYNLTIGCYYTIFKINNNTLDIDTLDIIDNNGDYVRFSLTKNDFWYYYNYYFYTEKEIRKQKLERINESRG